MPRSEYLKWNENDLHQVICDCCNATAIKRTYTRTDGMKVMECSGCGLAYLNPRPVDHMIDRLYGKEYFNGKSADKGIGLKLQSKEDRQGIFGRCQWEEPRQIALIENKIGHISGKKILEIGCATGELLLKIRDRGAAVAGLEISDYAAEIARGRSLDVYTGKVEEFAEMLQDEFDMVIALEVIEHVLSPTNFLQCVNAVLKETGYLLLSTPNYGCARKYGEGWLGFRTSFEHLWFFSVESLKKIAMKEGFLLTYWETSATHGGLREQVSAGEELWCKLKKWIAIEREVGIKELIKMKKKKKLDFYPYGDGHTLFLLFRKIDNYKERFKKVGIAKSEATRRSH